MASGVDHDLAGHLAPQGVLGPATRTSSGPPNGATLSTSTGVSGSSPSDPR